MTVVTFLASSNFLYKTIVEKFVFYENITYIIVLCINQSIYYLCEPLEGFVKDLLTSELQKPLNTASGSK